MAAADLHHPMKNNEIHGQNHNEQIQPRELAIYCVAQRGF